MLKNKLFSIIWNRLKGLRNFVKKSDFLLKKLVLSFLFVTFTISLFPGNLDEYIKIGLESNLVLKQEQFSLKKSLYVLREAKGMFLPSITINSRLSRAGGGRVIEFPVGDMLNPIHNTLNKLLVLQGETPEFPVNVENEHIPFLREKEHETKLRIIQPIFQPSIYYNLKIKSNLNKIESASVNAFKRKLVAEIKSAYFNHLKTIKIKELLDNTKLLLQENLRVSESLFKNGKVTEEIVFQSKSEISKIYQFIVEAKKNIVISRSYFNFLINRELDEKIDVDGNLRRNFRFNIDLKELESHALKHRNEITKLYRAIDAANNNIKLNKSSYLPAVSAVFDYGFQGEKYSFKGKDDFWIVSAVFSWNIFNGGQNKAKLAQAKIEKKRLQAQFSELENRIKLQVRNAYYNLLVSREALKSTKDLVLSTGKTFSIITKKFEQEMALQIEYIKARNDYTEAEINNIVTEFDYYIKEADLEYASAYYKFKNEEIKK